MTPANTFLVKYAKEIMPGVPVVFSGDQPGMIPFKDIPSNFAGIAREGNPAPAIRLILQAQPDTRKIYIVMGDSSQEREIRRSFPKDLALFSDKVEMVYLNHLPFPQLMETIRGISGPSVILYISYFQDVAKNNFVPAKVAGIISQAANVPTYGISAPYMGQGVVGGYQFSAGAVGERAAELGTKVLLGSRISDFPREQTAVTAEYRFDWRALKRWKIDERRLPRESKFEYRTPTLWEEYKWFMVGALILVLVETILIFGLLISNKMRKEKERELRESEEKYRSLFDNSIDAILLTVPDGKIMKANSEACRIFGRSEEEICRVGREGLLDPADPRLKVALEERKHTGRFRGELTFVSKNGTRFQGEVTTAIFKDRDGNQMSSMIIRDMTERKRTQQREQEIQALLRIAGDKAKLGGWSADLEENRVIWSDEVAVIHEMPAGYSPTVEQGISFYAPEWQERITKVFTDCAQKGIPYDEEMEIITVGKKRVWVRTIGEAVKNDAGKIIKVQGAFQDITDRKRAEEHLQQTLESLRKAVNATIQIMVSAVEARDPYTAGHQIRSADLARAIATEMGLPQEKIDGIHMAATIHDIGKLSIPAEILSKPTKLSEIEFSLIKEHSQKGYEMLKDVKSPWSLAQIIYQHHERMDGSGYPKRLKGDDILIEARILAVADVVEAMASHRPYRPTLGLQAALAEIENNKGILFDADAVEACMRLFREKRYQLMTVSAADFEAERQTPKANRSGQGLPP